MKLMKLHETPRNPSKKLWTKVGTTELTATGKKVLSTGGWLNDKHIIASEQLLEQQNFRVEGLQNPVLQESCTFDIQGGEFVQILNMSGNHWIAVSTIGYAPAHVQVYVSPAHSCSEEDNS